MAGALEQHGKLRARLGYETHPQKGPGSTTLRRSYNVSTASPSAIILHAEAGDTVA